MAEMVEYRTDAGETRAYLATPSSGSGPGVIVVQEWWGLVDHIRDVCDRFASEGFVALAPDLYDGDTADGPDEAGRMMQELQVEQAAMDLSGAVGYLLQHDAVTSEQVGVIGYCMGGSLALVTGEKNARKVGAVDAYYGVFWYGDPQFSAIECPVVMRIGTEDEFVSIDKVEELAEEVRSAGADVRVETYEGAGHAFFNDDRPDAYHEESANSAWKDTLDFLRTNLG